MNSDNSREVDQIDFFQRKFPDGVLVAYQNASFNAHVQNVLHIGIAGPAPTLKMA